jgi:hypothetical protein
LRRAFIASGRLGEAMALNRSWTAVESLLTFCPPGPGERMKLSSSSLSSIGDRVR